MNVNRPVRLDLACMRHSSKLPEAASMSWSYLFYSLHHNLQRAVPISSYRNGKPLYSIVGSFDYLIRLFFHLIRVNWEEAEKANSTNKIGVPFFSDHNAADFNPATKQRESYLIVYSTIIASILISFVLRSFSFFRMCVRISINLHDMIFRGVTRAKMLFFNNNPSGRVLNRFARDMCNVDSVLPDALFNVIEVK